MDFLLERNYFISNKEWKIQKIFTLKESHGKNKWVVFNRKKSLVLILFLYRVDSFILWSGVTLRTIKL